LGFLKFKGVFSLTALANVAVDEDTDITPDSGSLILDGRAYAKQFKGRLKQNTASFKAAHGFAPGLAVVLVGDDPASIEYSGVLVKTANNLGFTATHHVLSEASTASQLATLLEKLNRDPFVHGISLQWPLPPQITLEEATNALDPRKDVEGYHPISTGRLFSQFNTFVPATPLGGMQLLEYYGFRVEGKTCLQIGCGVTVGRPLLALLLGSDATVMVVNKRTPRSTLVELCAQADFVFSAAGQANLVTGEMLKPGAVVVDFGINFVDGKMVGDIDFESVCKVASAVTPTPGGTGPVTAVALLENVLKAANQQVK
jgi:methylenetetrahydrofolate dehydrogenase (NADP+)/methenyltetrahydrofolate cyclohydrolase